MDEQEKEQILYRVDEKVNNLDKKVDHVQDDVRANRDIFNDRLRKESKKIDETEDIARANRIKIAGLVFVCGSAMSAYIANLVGIIAL